MGNTNARGRTSGRRAAALLAALGALVMSSGVALMVTATPANAKTANPKVTFCHATGSDSNPYVKITTSVNGFYHSGHIDHSGDIYPAVTITKPNGDVVNVPQQGDQSILANGCEVPGSGQDGPALDATAAVDVTNPNCENDNTPDYAISGSHVTWVVSEEDLTPGGHVTVDFTTTEGHAFPNESSVKQIVANFGPAEEGCVVVEPPQKQPLTTQAPSFTEPTCTTPAGVTLPKQAEVLASRARTAAGPEVTTSDANGIHYVATGSLTPGGTVDVDATLLDPAHTTFAEGAVKHWSYTFTTPANCTTVAPPTSQVESSVVVSPPKAHVKTKTHAQAATVTPTVVEAGLASTTTQDLRGEQGLALVVAGMVMLIGAGGLTLRVRRAAARI